MVVSKLNTQIYLDGANYSEIIENKNNKIIKGFTTNPSLIKSSGIKNYKSFAKRILNKIKDKPVSFEVFADKLESINKEAYEIGSWGKNVYVKIPITNTKGNFTGKIIRDLLNRNIKCNITAVFTINQVKQIIKYANSQTEVIISIFAGRIADTGRDPSAIVSEAVKLCKKYKNIKILWASTREILNIYHANKCGCHIITVPKKIFINLKNIGKNLNLFSIETIKQFHKDSKEISFNIKL